jgi:hypothetical protein
MRLFLAFLAIAASLAGCAQQEIEFTADEPVQVELRPLASPYDAGEVVGDTPQKVPLAKLNGKVVRLSHAGKEAQYWLFSPVSGSKAAVKVKLNPAPAAEDKSSDRAVDANITSRLLIKACGALHAGDYKLARELAGKVSDVAPTLAAPYVLVGLSHLQEGRKADAKGALSKAKALDPSDQEVDELLKLAQ